MFKLASLFFHIDDPHSLFFSASADFGLHTKHVTGLSSAKISNKSNLCLQTSPYISNTASIGTKKSKAGHGINAKKNLTALTLGQFYTDFLHIIVFQFTSLDLLIESNNSIWTYNIILIICRPSTIDIRLKIHKIRLNSDSFLAKNQTKFRLI